MSDILVVDDEADIREFVSGILDDEGHETRMAADSDSALAAPLAEPGPKRRRLLLTKAGRLRGSSSARGRARARR